MGERKPGQTEAAAVSVQPGNSGGGSARSGADREASIGAGPSPLGCAQQHLESTGSAYPLQETWGNP